MDYYRRKHGCNPCCRPCKCKKTSSPLGIRINPNVVLALLFFLAGRNIAPAGTNRNVNVVNIGGEELEDLQDVEDVKDCKCCDDICCY